jgi:excisionase family DNA binding protein
MIENLYARFRRHTDGDTAAAILTLAAVLHGEQDRLLTVEQAADLRKCSTDAIYKLLQTGELPHIRTGKGGHYRIRESALLSIG